MNKYFMLTRGRTGSSAILDELGTANILSLQELFADFSLGIAQETLPFYPHFAPPLDVWVAILLGKSPQNWEEKFVNPRRNMDTLERTCCSVIKGFSKVLLPQLKGSQAKNKKVERYLIELYLKNIENQASECKKAGLVFKILASHLNARIPLFGLLKERKYRALLLVRRNVVRQVLSGLIAESRSLAEDRNLYNKKNHVAEHPPCNIDLDNFESCVTAEIWHVQAERSLLEGACIDYLEITYEDFCENREKFYSTIFAFMGLDYELPKPTDFSVMVPDIRKAVSNFDELEKRVELIGMKGSL